jgi:hypothetical protein
VVLPVPLAPVYKSSYQPCHKRQDIENRNRALRREVEMEAQFQEKVVDVQVARQSIFAPTSLYPDSPLYLRNPCRLRNQSLGRHSPTLTAQWIAIAMNNGARADNTVFLRVYFKHIQFDCSAKGIFDGKSVIIKHLL